MRIHPLALAVILGAAASACSKPEQSTATAPPPPQTKTVFDPQLRALDKAKTVEGTLQSDAQHLKESIDQQEAPPH